MDKKDTPQITDKEVTKRKFEQEIQNFISIEHEWRKKGVLKIKDSFPFIELIFLATRLKPISVLFAVRIDFTNYNTVPPSIVFINAVTGEPIKVKDMDVGFFQVKQVAFGPQMLVDQKQPILMGNPEDLPFLCIPGVREYHDHPAHTGDSWFLHKYRGDGTLGFLIDQLYNHSVPFVHGYRINQTIGFNQ